jgi:hypothetical protein
LIRAYDASSEAGAWIIPRKSNDRLAKHLAEFLIAHQVPAA